MNITKELHTAQMVGKNYHDANMKIKAALNAINHLYYISSEFIPESTRKALQEVEILLNDAADQSSEYNCTKYLEKLNVTDNK